MTGSVFDQPVVATADRSGGGYTVRQGDAIRAVVSATPEGHVDGPGRWEVMYVGQRGSSRKTHETPAAAAKSFRLRVDSWKHADGSENSCGVVGCTLRETHRVHDIPPNAASPR